MDKLYTINEVATKLNLSDKTLRRWEEAGRFAPSRTLGNQRRYSLDDLQILDAIKHGVISSQQELLSATQAASLCGVSPVTLARWEDEGKIHPFITSGHVYYPKSRLLAKLDELKASTPSDDAPPLSIPAPAPLPTIPTPIPTPLTPPTPPPSLAPLLNYKTYFYNLSLTLLTLTLYHLVLVRPLLTPPVEPQGAVQGTATTSLDPRVDDLLIKFTDHLNAERLRDSAVRPTTNITLDHTELVTSQSVLPKDQSQVSVTHPKLQTNSLVTVTFNGDFSPARKYWVTTTAGSFTVTTDFPVSADSPFTYQFLTPVATASGL